MTRTHSQRIHLRSVPLFIALLLSFSGWAASTAAQVPELPQTASQQVTGQVQWLLRYGLGDPQGLVQKNYSSGLFFSQSITLDANISLPVERPIKGTLSLLAHLDNQQPEFLQSLRMRWEAQNWQAEFGDFPMGRSGSLFASSSRLLKGFKVDWQLSQRVTLRGIYSQVSGILQSRTFRGHTVEETVTFAFRREDQPLLDESYLKNLRGLEHFPLGKDYVEGFTRILLSFTIDPRLEDLLQNYGLGYLAKTIEKDPEQDLDPSAYGVVFSGEEYYLILRSEFVSLLRERLQRSIEEYNRTQGLTGESRKEYPFSEGTDYERKFLEYLSEVVELKVDSRTYNARESGRQRFYALAHQGIQEDSVKVAVKVDDEFKDIDDPALAAYEFKAYADKGIIEFQFPQEFFENRESAVRVTYSYESGSGTYVLGLSVLQGSERVYLNGKLLQSGVDYLMEYEVGFLILLKEIGSDDVLRIEYELARGGLGGAADYSQNFQGITLSYQPLEGLQLDVDLLQAFDSPRSDISRETLATMPNTQTVVGLSGQLTGETLQGVFDLGFTLNRFPPDDNSRENLKNRIEAIHPLQHDGRTLILIGHRNGLQVYDGLDWSAYGVFEGLAGLVVYDIDSAPGQVIFATSGGISRLELSAGDPLASFARRSNWTNYSQEDGLPSNTIYAVLIDGNTLWVGTDRGLAKAPLDGLSEQKNWKIYRKSEHPEMLSDQVLRLAATPDWLYVGTDQGLMLLDPQREAFESVEELRGFRIHDLVTEGDTVYVATQGGVRALVGPQGVGWPVRERAVNAVAMGEQGELWYGTSQGLYSSISGLVSETRGRAITALGRLPEALWAGEEATSSYEMLVYRLSSALVDVKIYTQDETLLDGRAKGRFMDIPAAEHTDYGWVGRISLEKQFGPVQLQGVLEGVSPRFTPIGTLDRQDHVQLNLSAIYPLSTAVNLHATHQEGLSDLLSDPSQILQDTVGLRFSPDSGPQLDLDYTIRHVDQDFQQAGFDRTGRSYTLSASQQLLDNRLSLRLGYELDQTQDVRRPVYSSTESQLTAEAVFQALPGLTLRAAYRQPMNWRFGELAGDRRLDWGANWSTSIPWAALPLDLQANYQGNGRLPLAGPGRTLLDQNAGMLLRSAAVQLGGLSLLPQVALSLRAGDLLGTNSSMQWNGEGTLQGTYADLEGRIGYKRVFFTHERTRLERLQDSVSLHLSYQGMPTLRPTVQFTGSLETLLHPFFGQKVNGQYEISLELLWVALGPLQADLLLSRRVVDTDREHTISYSLQQSLEYALTPIMSPRLEFQVDYIQGDQDGEAVDELKGDLSLVGSFPIVEEWNATVTAEYLLGLGTLRPRSSYNSFVVTVQVGRPFALF